MRDDFVPESSDSLSAEDPSAFRQVFDAHLDPLRRFVFTYVGSWETAEEIVNDTFLQLWLRLRQGEPVRDVKAYLYTMARNRAVSRLRHQRIVARHLHDRLEPEIRAGAHVLPPDAEDLLEAAELAAALQRAIDALPPRQRDVILLRLHRDATQEEIAAVLGIAAKTVSDHYRGALDRLRRILPNFFADPT